MGVLLISSILGKEGKRSAKFFFKLASCAQMEGPLINIKVAMKACIKRMGVLS
jgi:hypothetical protein